MTEHKNKYLIIVLGPTGIGKTAIGIELAKKYKTEILSCDSRQFYKELSIGTAVPDKDELKQIRHHFIHHKSVLDYYNASMFEIDALTILEKLFQKSNKVIMAGGSGLYIDAVCYGIDDFPTIDQDLRNQLKYRYNNEGLSGLRLELKKLDPVYYDTVDLRNPKRILKALEVCLMTGKPYSLFLSKPKKERPFKYLKIGLNTDREQLYTNINKRVDEMISNGLVKEAKANIGNKDLNALNTVGYREIFEYIEGKISLDMAVELIKRNSRRYARRQLTWFRRYSDIEWFGPDDLEKIFDYVDSCTR